MHKNPGAKTLPAHPFTFGGIAGASQTWGRLILVQGWVGAVVAAAVLWLLAYAWFPIINAAIDRLPAEGSVRDGALVWYGASVTNLANGKFLSIYINLDGRTETGSEADLQLELVRTELRMRSILGYLVLPYPPSGTLALNRVQLEPWWGAWKPAFLAAIGAATLLALVMSWSLLATVYCVPVWVIGYFADRQLNWPRAWRLAAAALLPGALLFSCALIAYSLQQINLLQLIIAWLVHFAVGWFYLLGAPFRAQRIPKSDKKKNPFATFLAG